MRRAADEELEAQENVFLAEISEEKEKEKKRRRRGKGNRRVRRQGGKDETISEKLRPEIRSYPRRTLGSGKGENEDSKWSIQKSSGV